MQTVFPSADTAMPAGAFGSERMCSDRAAIGWTPGTAAKRGIVTMRRVLKGR
ncbi:hypothetical protein K9U40_15170 [Xanthobacter autotrophicus]|uniref:hypothetical protein n=1 Tax=Xanthobacter TaxID=279 RepID=UPI0024AB5C61|nr:hypothetical protein [Xanthobacter autotrophicus]MDI4665653.1 hypothetical protein [Xanthobacter autotrophicus]